jgi:hypothetical protein
VYHYGYLIGTRGQKCSLALIQKSWNNFPTYRTNIEKYAKQWLINNPDKGKSSEETNEWKVADCEGWEEAFRNGGDIGNPLDDSELVNPDVSTGVVYLLAKNMGLPNGPIDTLPKNCPYPIPVGYPGHVGFYHLGMVYEAAGHEIGTICVALESTKWNHAWEYWYVSPYYDYEGWFEGDGIMVLEKGCPDGQMVYNYQIICKKLGGAVGNFKDMVLKDATGNPIRTGCDGDYGDTMVAVSNEFCKKYGLPTTTLGTVTDILMGKLNAELQALATGIPQAQ